MKIAFDAVVLGETVAHAIIDNIILASWRCRINLNRLSVHAQDSWLAVFGGAACIFRERGQTYQSASQVFDETMDDSSAWATGLRQRRGGRGVDERQRRHNRVDRLSSMNDNDENEQRNDDESKDQEDDSENDDDVGNDDRSPITPRQSRNTTTNNHSNNNNNNSRAIRDNISTFPPGSARPAANMARLASFVSDGAAAVVTVLAGPNSPLPPGPQEGLGRLMSGLGGGGGGVAGGGGTMVAAGYGGGGTGGVGGGGGFTTPYKGPFKGEENGLVETPSSITTAGQTADSTTLATQSSPLNVRRLNSQRRRRGSMMNDTSNTTSLQRQYRILRNQIIFLLGSSALGLLLFLFYALPLAAFASLIFFVSSLGALLPVLSQMAMAQYQLEMQHPLGLIRHLPDSVRIMLTETTLHEFMADTTFFMEYRYLLLYFIPGLRPEQLMEYIDRLPSRHREALLRPGLGRLMPSVMESLMRIDENDEGVEYELVADEDDNANTDDGELSVASGLTIIDREPMLVEVNDEEDYDDDDAPVTLFETIGGLRRTIIDFMRGNGSRNDDIVSNPTLPTTEASATYYSANATPTTEENQDNEEEDDDASFEFSLDISTAGLTNIVREGAPTAVAATSVRGVVTTSSNNKFDVQNVIVGPQSPDSESNDANSEQVQQEYDLEGIILAEATSAATAYYASQATAVAVNAATEAVVTTSSWIIWTGSWTGIIAGGGGIVASILADYSFLSLGFGSVNTISLGFINNAERGDRNSSNGTISERRSSYVPAVYGFFATSAFGFIGAGVAYLVRNRARAAIAAKREEQEALIDIPSKEDEAGDA